jgi:hypothetical protein
LRIFRWFFSEIRYWTAVIKAANRERIPIDQDFVLIPYNALEQMVEILSNDPEQYSTAARALIEAYMHPEEEEDDEGQQG